MSPIPHQRRDCSVPPFRVDEWRLARLPQPTTRRKSFSDDSWQ